MKSAVQIKYMKCSHYVFIHLTSLSKIQHKHHRTEKIMSHRWNYRATTTSTTSSSAYGVQPVCLCLLHSSVFETRRKKKMNSTQAPWQKDNLLYCSETVPLLLFSFIKNKYHLNISVVHLKCSDAVWLQIECRTVQHYTGWLWREEMLQPNMFTVVKWVHPICLTQFYLK